MFYRLLVGADATMRQKFKLLDGPGHYRCLNRFIDDGIMPEPGQLALHHEGEICMFEICDRSKWRKEAPSEFLSAKPPRPGEDSDDLKEWRSFLNAMQIYFEPNQMDQVSATCPHTRSK